MNNEINNLYREIIKAKDERINALIKISANKDETIDVLRDIINIKSGRDEESVRILQNGFNC